MFGYIRPYTDALSEEELNKFRCAYCSLCHTLRENYGQISRMVLNYDFVLMAILLSSDESDLSTCEKGCIVHPIKKRMVFENSCVQLDKCAAYSIILAYWKIRDSAEDENFLGKIKALFAGLAMRRAYKKASGKYGSFDKTVRRNLSELSAFEAAGEKSIDLPADKFAGILAAASDGLPERDRRIKSEFFYQLGRWIYIIDAYNDLPDDLKSGNYNPISAKYHLRNISQFNENIKNEVEITLNHSLMRLSSAFELMDEHYWSALIRNIIYLGMPAVFLAVKSGEFDTKSKDTLE